MEQSNLVELIKTLNSTEKTQILQFVKLDFINYGRMRIHVAPLLAIFLNHSWNNSEQKLEKRAVFEQLFPKQKFIEGKLEKVMVDAHKVIRIYLLNQHYFREANEFQQNFDFAEILRLRRLDSRFRQLLSKIQKTLSENPWKNGTHYHSQFILEYAVHDEQSLHNQKKGDLNIPNAIYSLESYSYLNKLALCNRFLLQQKITTIDESLIFNKIIEDISIHENEIHESTYVEVNKKIFIILKKPCPESSDVRVLFDLLLLHEKSLDLDSLREFYTYLRNICVLVLMHGKGAEEIILTLHELYKDNLLRGFLHYDGKLHPSRYFGISENAIRIRQFEWANNFIEENKNLIIGENETHDIYRFNKAYYLFAIGNYSEALDFIPPTSPFVDYLVAAKRLELKALYELNSDLLPYKLDAFKMFLSRTSHKLLSGILRQLNGEFANLLSQIISSIPGDKKRSELLIKRVEEKKQALEWTWLLAKAHALKEK